MIEGYSAIPIICGPTASGKSDVALELCRLTGGELISCDSMQIYKHLDVGTAKASAEEREEIPHHLIDVVDPGTDFSVNDYLKLCFESIEDIMGRGKLPVICGGTGQYVSALRDGIRYVDEPVPDEIVNGLYEEAGSSGIDGIYGELESIDPEAASKIHRNNTRRVIRALAVYRATGKTFTEWNRDSKKTGPRYPFILFEPDYEDARDILYDRINRRVDKMMDLGLEEEARFLYSLDIDKKSTCFQAIGYKEFKEYLNNGTNDRAMLDKAIYDIKLNSRHYAKRQLTWYRYIDGIVKLDRTRTSRENAETCLEILKNRK
ncbi:MAG TPA: tRNA (adenosine(37)-N6)-dimethylallyltransferase MiaA [Clostridiales bacterium]|nr:tRNA (adenosine(37)-N6)-dimethylallyltransferase MiaA [Clostridiales bacterium]